MGSEVSYLLATLCRGLPTVYFSCLDFGAKIQKIGAKLQKSDAKIERSQKNEATTWRKRFFGKGPFYPVLVRPSGGGGIGVELGITLK